MIELFEKFVNKKVICRREYSAKGYVHITEGKTYHVLSLNYRYIKSKVYYFVIINDLGVEDGYRISHFEFEKILRNIKIEYIINPHKFMRPVQLKLEL